MLGKSAKESVTGSERKKRSRRLAAVHRNIRGVDGGEKIVSFELFQNAFCPNAMGKHEDLVVRNAGQRSELFHSGQRLFKSSSLKTQRLASQVLKFFMIVVISVNADREPLEDGSGKAKRAQLRFDRNSKV